VGKRLLLLNGLAILAVVCNHAAGWGEIAMFWWMDRYCLVTTPNFDQLGTWPYWGLAVITHLPFFALPAFMFVSGFFVAYAARGSQSTLSWKMVKVRIANLLVPYLIWSVVIFVGDALQGITYTPVEYLVRLATGNATPPYFYVPLICQFYLVSPLVVPIAKTRGRLLLIASALLQLGTGSLRYLDAFGVEIPGLDLMLRLTPHWSLPRWAFFSTFGLVSAFHISQIKGWLARFKWRLLFAVILLGTLTVLEGEVMTRMTGERWGGPLRLSGSLYALAFILCFLRFDKVSIPFSRALYQLGRRSYGIYLLHYTALEFFARVIRQIAPWILAYQVTLFVPVLITLAVGVPLLFMAAVRKSPMRRSYRYLFG